MWIDYYSFVKFIEYIGVKIVVVERQTGQRQSSNIHGQVIVKREFDGEVMVNGAWSSK